MNQKTLHPQMPRNRPMQCVTYEEQCAVWAASRERREREGLRAPGPRFPTAVATSKSRPTHR
jgi:hypothetical protein